MYNLNENCTFAIQGTHKAHDAQTPYRSSVASANRHQFKKKMIKHNKFKEVVEKGAENYISILKNVDLYDEVAERIIRRFNPDPIAFIKQKFEKKSNFWEPIFSDLNYSMDFYEGFEFNVKAIIDFSFPDKEIDYQIITNFYERVTKKIIYTHFDMHIIHYLIFLSFCTYAYLRRVGNI